MKELFHREYGMKKGSTKVLWNLISTAHGLSEWFADRVDLQGNVFTFMWKKSTEQAILVSQVTDDRIRFRWIQDPENVYFELKIVNSDLTGEISLIVTDFAEPDEVEDAVNLWNSEIEKLIRRIGL